MIFSRKAFWASAALAAGLFASAALAADIKVSAPWSRATVRGATVGVGFLTIENKGAEPDRLLGGTSDVAEKLEIHETRSEGGVMKMRELPQGIEIKPGQTVVLKPGATHLMLVGLKAAMFPGGVVHATLNFAKAGPIAVDLPVEGFGATGPIAAPPPAEPPQISY
ncbi:copper chaperone PCu(A)C [Rhodoblastus sp.]|uniref:copper chaperone PCu(A)C n=1 Tax=Rhodoblastus sp. TaxID=1962975 RepID=UPI003F967487